MRPCWPYPYVSRLLALPPEVAEFHFDLACLGLVADGRRGGTPGPLVVEVPSGRLEFARTVRFVAGRRAYRPLRAVRGTLQPAGWWVPGIAVDLELLPWSATRSELALIAGPVRRSGHVGERRYLRLAHEVLDVLVDAVHTAGEPAELAQQPSVVSYRRKAG